MISDAKKYMFSSLKKMLEYTAKRGFFLVLKRPSSSKTQRLFYLPLIFIFFAK